MHIYLYTKFLLAKLSYFFLPYAIFPRSRSSAGMFPNYLENLSCFAHGNHNYYRTTTPNSDLQHPCLHPVMPDLTICRHSADFWTSKTTLKTEWRLTTFDLSKSSTFLCTEASWKFKKNCLFWAKFKKKILWRQIWRLFIFPWRYFEKYIWHQSPAIR